MLVETGREREEVEEEEEEKKDGGNSSNKSVGSPRVIAGSTPIAQTAERSGPAAEAPVVEGGAVTDAATSDTTPKGAKSSNGKRAAKRSRK